MEQASMMLYDGPEIALLNGLFAEGAKLEERVRPKIYAGNQPHIRTATYYFNGLSQDVALKSDDMYRSPINQLPADEVWEMFRQTHNKGKEVKEFVLNQAPQAVINTELRKVKGEDGEFQKDDQGNFVKQPVEFKNGYINESNTILYLTPWKLSSAELVEKSGLYESYVPKQRENETIEQFSDRLGDRVADMMFEKLNEYIFGDDKDKHIDWRKVEDVSLDSIPKSDEIYTDKGRQWINDQLKMAIEQTPPPETAKAAVQALFIYGSELKGNKPDMLIGALNDIVESSDAVNSKGELFGKLKEKMPESAEMISAIEARHNNLRTSSPTYAILDIGTSFIDRYLTRSNAKNAIQLFKRGVSYGASKKDLSRYASAMRVTGQINDDVILSRAGGTLKYPPLQYAVLEENTEAIGAVLENGADINARYPVSDSDGMRQGTILDIAVMRKSPKVVEKLLDGNLDQVAIESALFSAIHKSKSEALDLMINRGFNLDITNANITNNNYHRHPGFHQKSLITKAVEKGNAKIVEQLVEAGVNPNVKSSDDGYSPIHVATIRGNNGALKALLKSNNIDLNNQDFFGNTALHIAAKPQYRSSFNILVEKEDINLNAVNAEGKTPLHMAVDSENLEAVRTLIQKGANTKISSQTYGTPLKSVTNNILHNPNNRRSKKHKLLIMDELLKAEGVDIENVNAKDSDGNTQLHNYVKQGRLDLVEALVVAKNARIDIKNKDGSTAMHSSVESGNDAMVEALIYSRSKAWNYKNKDGLTPLHVAARSGNGDIIRSLQHADSINFNVTERKNGFTPLHIAAKEGKQQAVHALIVNPAVHANAIDKQNRTPLHIAVMEGDPNTVKTFAQMLSVSVNSVDDKGETPLHYAIKGGNKEIFDSIVKREDLDFSIADKNGNTALHLAVKLGKEDFVKDILNKINKLRSDFDGFDFEKAFEPLEGSIQNDIRFTDFIDNSLHDDLMQMAALVGDVGAEPDKSSFSIDKTNADKDSALNVAIIDGNFSIATILLSAGANPDNVGSGGISAIKQVLQASKDKEIDKEFLKQLLASKDIEIDKINSQDRDGKTPLRKAIESGDNDIASLLIISNADVNLSDGDGVCPCT